MKKIYLTLILALSMSCNVFAQGRDGFFNIDNDDIYSRLDDPNGLLNMPTGGLGSTANEPAPLGDGLIILTALGAAYTLRHRNNKPLE